MQNIKNTKPIFTVTRVIVRADSRMEFFQTITPLTKRIQAEAGCLNYRWYDEIGCENSLLVVEEWVDELSWVAHRNGENFAVMVGLIMVLCIPSEIAFSLLEHIGGHEVIPNVFNQGS